ncbi:MAG TPA: hypothetical protein VFB78_15760 [Acidimicrobiales bacterium]|jgi:hypothetical protein|nr:hypothetical protein [Acidimicrobiales bacterium]
MEDEDTVVEAAVDETTPPPPAPPLWVGLVTWASVVIVALVALQLVGIVGQAVALGGQTKQLNFADRLGYSFLQNLDQAPLGLELLLAVLLALTPIMARRPTNASQDRWAQYVLVAVAGLALLIAIGGILGVPARVHIIDKQNAKVTGVVQWVLFTFVVRNVATALLAMAASMAAVRVRFAPRRPATVIADS